MNIIILSYLLCSFYSRVFLCLEVNPSVTAMWMSDKIYCVQHFGAGNHFNHPTSYFLI